MKNKTLWRMKRFLINGLICRIFMILIIFWISSILMVNLGIKPCNRLNNRFNSNYNQLFLSKKPFSSITIMFLRLIILMINMILLIISICFLTTIKTSSLTSKTSLILTNNQLSRGYSDHYLIHINIS